MKQLTEQEAIDFAESEKWKSMTDEERFNFQIRQKRLCMPFFVFRDAAQTLYPGIMENGLMALAQKIRREEGIEEKA